jgi:hypothetical protein
MNFKITELEKSWFKIPHINYYINENCNRIISLGRNCTNIKELDGCLDKNGYRWFLVTLDGKRKRLGLHHLSYMTFIDNNFKPSREFVCDHIDNDRNNNHPSNLQVITHRLNTIKDKYNKKSSKYPGVCIHKNTGKYTAQVRYNNKKYHLGYFTNEEEAYEVYKSKLFDLTKIKID